MNKQVMTVDEVDTLISIDSTRMWWETYAKTFVSFRPGRGATYFKPDGYYNRRWRGRRGRWGTIKRVEISEDGMFRL